VALCALARHQSRTDGKRIVTLVRLADRRIGNAPEKSDHCQTVMRSMNRTWVQMLQWSMIFSENRLPLFQIMP
jgi:hypothetical protein